MATQNEKALDLINMGIGLMREENYGAAKETFGKALQADPTNYDAFIHLGNACVNLGEMDDAIMAFTNALAVKPDAGEALFSIGNVYYLQDDFRRAVKYYNKTEAAGYKSVDMYLIMAEIFGRVNDTEQVLRCLNRALKLEPLRGDIWRRKTVVLIDAGKFDDAQETLDQFLELLPDALDAYDLQSRLLCAQEKYDEALQKLQPAKERFPDDPQIKMVELYICSEAGRNEQVKALIGELKEKGLDTGRRKTLGMEEARMYLTEGKNQEMVSSLEWALEEDPDDSELLYLLLSAYIQTLDHNKIVVTADRVVASKNPAPSLVASAKFYRAMSLRELGKEEQAKAEFRSLTKELRDLTIQNPGLTEIYMLRLLTHCNLGEYDQAFQLADYLQNISPDSADGHAYRHLIYKQMGDEKKAAEELAAARAINPDIPD